MTKKSSSKKLAKPSMEDLRWKRRNPPPSPKGWEVRLTILLPERRERNPKRRESRF
ncbi:hypothetical protein CDL12_18349 [Handroanthus impetiginosus]|uniref:Uncharacterized protein n=1 Tax=Handroanthus impetiginosus TaxID=429701 RepID=A0A2G9GUV8_9LAMI|nr:hypothetical protein CDL12_18349 [Handroanthus impetiginosus]